MNEGDLIFIISQPRAGSTLLQLMLGHHPEICTMAEPWLMLHPIYGIGKNGIEAEYGFQPYSKAIRDFLNSIEEGRQKYFEAIQKMALLLYDGARKTSGKPMFLDKTPRYYFIIDELIQVFPNANYIVLVRNPIAVLSSILQTWVKSDLFSLYKFREDILTAPFRIVDAMSSRPSMLIVRYEDLVNYTDEELARICAYLRIDFVPEMKYYDTDMLSGNRFGDSVGIRKDNAPSQLSVEKWKQLALNKQVQTMMRDYLEFLGKDITEKMGYGYDDLLKDVEKIQPTAARFLPTLPLSFFLKKRSEKCILWGNRVLRRTYFRRKRDE